jgi:hypothetical protein
MLLAVGVGVTVRFPTRPAGRGATKRQSELLEAHLGLGFSHCVSM